MGGGSVVLYDINTNGTPMEARSLEVPNKARRLRLSQVEHEEAVNGRLPIGISIQSCFH